MRFGAPILLWLLLLVPLTGVFLWWTWREKQRLIARFVQARLLAMLTVGVSKQRQKARLILILVSVALLVFVAARPQWGFDWEEVKQKGLDIVVAIDTSRSMLANDVYPTRLERAKLAALDLKRLARTDRVGLVAFAGTAFLQCPLSLDDEAFRQSVNALDVNIIPQGGTALAEAIQAALGAFKEGSENHKVLILFTDGEDHDGNALDAVKSAAKEGLRIFTVGVGTANGELLRVADARGNTDFIKDSSGNVVKSRLDEQLLKDIAREANGFYLLMSGGGTVDTLYKQGLAPLPKSEFSAKMVRRHHEQFYWFLAAVIVLLIVEMFLPDRKRARRVKPAVTGSTKNAAARAASVLLLVLWPLAAPARTQPGDALQQYQKGKFDRAQRFYEEVLKQKPNDPRLHFNAGSAAFQAKDFEEAEKHFNASLNAPEAVSNLGLQQRAYYNLGNTKFRVGEQESDPSGKQASWEQSITNYTKALALNPNDADAKFNLELVKQKLEELKKQQEQQKQDKQDQSKQDDQKKDQQNKDQKKDEQKKDSQQQDKPDPKKQQEQKQDQQGKQDEAKDERDQKKGGSEKKPGDKDEEGEQARAYATATMTVHQAQQLLDALKSEEKPMIFTPQLKTNRTDRVFKDW